MTTTNGFKEAYKVALNSNFKKTHIGCIAIYKGKIISTGCNSEKTHPMQQYYNKYRSQRTEDKFMPPKIHTEMKCISTITDIST